MGKVVTISFRFVYLIALGGLIVLWYLDFDIIQGLRSTALPFKSTEHQEQILAPDAQIPRGIRCRPNRLCFLRGRWTRKAAVMCWIGGARRIGSGEGRAAVKAT